MYKLTLTHGERRAIDWVGGRYHHGHKLWSLLWQCKLEQESVQTEPEWDDACDIAFLVPEHIAWQIGEIAEECEHRWDCFAPDLVAKLEAFLSRVV